MSMTLSTLCSANPPIKPLDVPFKIFPKTSLSARTRGLSFSFGSSHIRAQSLQHIHTHGFSGIHVKQLGLSIGRSYGLLVKAESGDGERKNAVDRAEEEARGQSTMPERFRHLTKEVPDKPVRWPWLIALAFLVYGWRTVLWELYNWKRAAVTIMHFLGSIFKFGFAIILSLIGDPITSLIRFIETSFYNIRAFYSGIVAYAPVSELTMIIILASVVLAIAETASPDSVNSQPYILTVAGLIGFVAVRGFISELFFWVLLLGLFGFARFIKKRDYVTSALPVATVLAAVGEPWVRLITIASYSALAITQLAKKISEGKEIEGSATAMRVPLPLLGAALAIGIRVAATWAGYRHLTWMIV